MAKAYGHDARMAKYKKWLERGAETHGALGQVCGDQIMTLQKFVDSATEDQDDTLARVLIAIHEAENAVHTAGLTFALGALAICGALGQDVPEPPDLPEIEVAH